MPRTAPRAFFVIAIVATIWNLIGIAAFIMQARTASGPMTDLPPVQAAVWRAMPMWAWAAYAIAVFVALGGSIALLRQRRFAVPAYLVSLIAVFFQFGYSFFIARIASVVGQSALIFPLFIIAVAIAELGYARHAARRGWLD